MAHRDLAIAADEIYRTAEENRARIVARLRHRQRLLPDTALCVQSENLGERRLLRLRPPAEYVDASAIDGGSSRSARLDRRTRGPAITRRIVDLDIAEISGPASSTN